MPGIDARALFGETLGDGAREGEIDVVAAQEDMLADGDADERERTFFLRYGD